MKYRFFSLSWYLALLCFSVFSLYTMHDHDQSLVIRALDLPQLSEYKCDHDSTTTQYTQALYKRGLLYKAHNSNENNNNNENVINYFAAAAHLGYRPSCYELSTIMRERREYAQAIYWLLQAARAEQVNNLPSGSGLSSQHALLTLKWYLPALCCIEEIYEGLYGQELYRALINAEYQGDYYTQLFTQACTCYAEKNYAQAYEIFNFLGYYYHPLALYMLGVCYDTGNGSERDAQRAYSYYKQAALYGYTQAQQACVWRDTVGKLEDQVIQVTQQLERLDLSGAEISADHITSVDALLSELVTYGTLEDNEHCARLLERKNLCSLLERYAQSSSYAAYLCGLMYKNRNAEKSDAYLKIAAQKNRVRASFILGEYYQKISPIQALDYYLSCALTDTDTGEIVDYEQQFIRTAHERIQEGAAKQDSYARICLVLYGIAHKNTQIYTKALQACENIFFRASGDTTLAKLIEISALPATLVVYAHSDARIEYLRALLYLKVPGFIDIKRGMNYLQLSAAKEIPEAQLLLSIYLTYGFDGVERDSAQAFSLLVKAHEQGFYLATFHLACAYQDTLLMPQDLKKAQELLNSSCLDQCVLALCYRLVDLLEQPVHNNTTTAMHNLLAVLEDHAQAGDKDACLTLGMTYYSARDSWGQDKLARAFKYLEKAAAQGYTRAYRIIGRMLYFAEGITGNRAYGEELLCKARLLGDQEAICDLADIFYDKQEYTQAFLYYLDSYKQTKSADAAAGLALCYVNGHGIRQDIRQAVNYMSFALKKGVDRVAGFKSLHAKRVLSYVLNAVIELVNSSESGEPTARFMLDLLTRVLNDVGFTWKEKSDTIIVYPHERNDIAQLINQKET